MVKKQNFEIELNFICWWRHNGSREKVKLKEKPEEADINNSTVFFCCLWRHLFLSLLIGKSPCFKLCDAKFCFWFKRFWIFVEAHQAVGVDEGVKEDSDESQTNVEPTPGSTEKTNETVTTKGATSSSGSDDTKTAAPTSPSTTAPGKGSHLGAVNQLIFLLLSIVAFAIY